MCQLFLMIEVKALTFLPLAFDAISPRLLITKMDA
jgi:hypothetical protein